MSSSEPLVRINERPDAVVLTLDNPPLNVLTLEVIGELRRGLARVAESRRSVLLIRGAGGRAFCAGVDVAAHAPESVDEMLEAFHGFLRELVDQDKPVVAVVEGDAFGGGFEWITICDLVIAAAHARFGQPEIDVGCFPPVAAALLPEAVGHQRAAEIMYLGRPVEAARAAALGLVNWVEPLSAVERRVDWLLEILGEKSGAVLRETRRAMLIGTRAALGSPLAATERVYREELVATRDMAEGVTAFMEKRAPEWRHE